MLLFSKSNADYEYTSILAWLWRTNTSGRVPQMTWKTCMQPYFVTAFNSVKTKTMRHGTHVPHTMSRAQRVTSRSMSSMGLPFSDEPIRFLTNDRECSLMVGMYVSKILKWNVPVSSFRRPCHFWPVKMGDVVLAETYIVWMSCAPSFQNGTNGGVRVEVVEKDNFTEKSLNYRKIISETSLAKTHR